MGRFGDHLIMYRITPFSTHRDFMSIKHTLVRFFPENADDSAIDIIIWWYPSDDMRTIVRCSLNRLPGPASGLYL